MNIELENELREALARTSPPPGFAARVMDAIEHDARAPRRQTRVWWQWAAAAALLMAISGGTTAHYYIERQREGERAKEQVLLALHITGAKLRDAREHVRAVAKPED